MYQETLQNQFSTSYCKSVIAQAFDEIMAKTAIKYCIDTIAPQGLSSTQMGRVSSKNFRWVTDRRELDKTPKTITRRIRDGKVEVEVNLKRPIKWANGYRVTSDVDALQLEIAVIDLSLFDKLTGVSTYDKGFYMTDALYLFKWESTVHQFPIDDSKTVEEIVLKDIVNEFKANSNEILDNWSVRVSQLRDVSNSLSKYV